MEDEIKTIRDEVKLLREKVARLTDQVKDQIEINDFLRKMNNELNEKNVNVVTKIKRRNGGEK